MGSEITQSNQTTLQDRLAVLHQLGKAMPQREAMRVIHDVLRTLASSHQVGQMHGLVSPTSVARVGSGWQLLPPSEDAGSQAAAYLSPERGRNGRPSLRDDVYAVGKLMLTLLANGRAEVLGTLTDDLQEVIIKCTSTDPRWRYETAGMVVAALDGLSRARVACGVRVLVKALGGVAGLAMLVGVGSIVVSLATGQTPSWWPKELRGRFDALVSTTHKPSPTPAPAMARSGATPNDQSPISNSQPFDSSSSSTTNGNGDGMTEFPTNDHATGGSGSGDYSDDKNSIQDTSPTDGSMPDSPTGDSETSPNGDGPSAHSDTSATEQDPCASKPGGLMFIEMGGASPVQQASDQYAVDWGNEVLFTWQVPQSHTVHLRDDAGTAIADSRQGDSLSVSVHKPRMFRAVILGCDGEEKVSREWQVTPLLRNLIIRTKLKIRDDENGSDEYFRSWEHPEWPAQQEIGFDEFHRHATLSAHACAGDEVKVFYRYEFNLLDNGDIHVKPYMDIGEGTDCDPDVNNRRYFEPFDLPGTLENQTLAFVTRTYHLDAEPHDPSEAWLEVSLANALGTTRPTREP